MPLLLVDDDDEFRALAKEIVTAWGHEVAEAATVAEARARAAELRPDTVLADVGLPDGDGFGLARALLALPWPMRVILISSNADAARGGALRRSGAIAFFSKDELSSPALRELLAGR
jgi:CheY-like chemotaxis protein